MRADMEEQLSRLTKIRSYSMFVLLVVTKFLGITGNSLLIPFYPQVASARGFSDFHIGMVFSVFELAVFILSPVFGAYVGKIGPKVLLITGSTLCGLCSIAFCFMIYVPGTAFLVLSIIIRLINGASDAMLTCGDNTILMSSFKDSIGRVMGVLEMSEGVAQIAGPALGTGLYLAGGFSLPFAFIGVVLLICSVSLFFLVPKDVCQKSTDTIPLSSEPETLQEGGSKNSLKPMVNMMKIPGVVVNFLVCLSVPLAISSLFPVLGNWMIDKFDFDTKKVGLLFIAWSAAYAVFSPFIGWVSDKGFVYGLTLTCLLGLSAMFSIIGPFCLLVAEIYNNKLYGVVIAALIFIGIFGAGANIPPYQACLDLAYMNGYKDDLNTIGIVAGLLESAFCLGTFAGTLLSGLITDRLGFEWSATVMMFIVIFVAVLLVTYMIYRKIVANGRHGPPAQNCHKEEIEMQDDLNKPSDVSYVRL